MPNNVIVQVHRLAVAAKEYEGIIFIDIHSNILTDQMKRSITHEYEQQSQQITGVNENVTGLTTTRETQKAKTSWYKRT
jgi:uncharacterized protein with von Willebrand factor type A (vWA) domain